MEKVQKSFHLRAQGEEEQSGESDHFLKLYIVIHNPLPRSYPPLPTQ